MWSWASNATDCSNCSYYARPLLYFWFQSDTRLEYPLLICTRKCRDSQLGSDPCSTWVWDPVHLSLIALNATCSTDRTLFLYRLGDRSNIRWISCGQYLPATWSFRRVIGWIWGRSPRSLPPLPRPQAILCHSGHICIPPYWTSCQIRSVRMQIL